MASSVVLLSSGLDSTINLLKANKEMNVSRVLTFDYGQRAAMKEIEFSARLCKKLKLKHEIVEIPWFKNITHTSLIDTSQAVPQGKDIQMDNHEQSLVTAKAVWVPNRNGVFLNIAASFAESLGADYIVPGFNKEEAETFPDNSIEFLKAIDKSLHFSTASHIKTLCYTVNMDKIEIVKLGKELNADFTLMWPCYFSGKELCESCESCRRFIRALESSGIVLKKMS